MTQANDILDGPIRSSDRLPALARRVAFCLVAAFICLGPAPGHLLGQHHPWLREWRMFSGVGIGIPKGTFTIRNPDGTIRDLTPLEAAGLDRYPNIKHYLFPGRVRAPQHLRRFAAALCEQAAIGANVSFEGAVGTRDGWLPMQADDICAHGEPSP